jgi:hypothetical protein
MANIIGAVLRPALKAKQCAFAAPFGEVGRFCSANKKIFADFSYSLRLAY